MPLISPQPPLRGGAFSVLAPFSVNVRARKQRGTRLVVIVSNAHGPAQGLNQLADAVSGEDKCGRPVELPVAAHVAAHALHADYRRLERCACALANGNVGMLAYLPPPLPCSTASPFSTLPLSTIPSISARTRGELGHAVHNVWDALGQASMLEKLKKWLVLESCFDGHGVARSYKI